MSVSLFLSPCEISRTAHCAPQQQGLITICLDYHSCCIELEACLSCIVSETFQGQNFDPVRGCYSEIFGNKLATVFSFSIVVAEFCLLYLLCSYPILRQGMRTGRTCRLTLCSLGNPAMSSLVWNILPVLRYRLFDILSGYLCLQAVLSVIDACE